MEQVIRQTTADRRAALNAWLMSADKLLGELKEEGYRALADWERDGRLDGLC